ncbi:MAG: hypothetical protein J4G15_08020 [Alphaproteobacteria bacterium]|nr:hypothetical protein [Alphaproteobacteria bacterium]
MLTDAPEPRLIVDFDRPGSPLAREVTRCDYLLIAEDRQEFGWVAPLELKRGQLHADQVVRQLQAGASAAEKLVSEDEATRFRPVAASGSVSKHERIRLKNRRNMIRFHGHMQPVRLMSCGGSLVKALGS